MQKLAMGLTERPKGQGVRNGASLQVSSVPLSYEQCFRPMNAK